MGYKARASEQVLPVNQVEKMIPLLFPGYFDGVRWTVNQAWREGPWAEASFLSAKGWREAKGLHTFKPIFFNYWSNLFTVFSEVYVSKKGQ